MTDEPPRAQVVKAPAALGQEFALVAPTAMTIDLRRVRRQRWMRRAAELGVAGVWFYLNPIGALLFAVVGAWIERAAMAAPVYRRLDHTFATLEHLYKAGRLRAAERYIARREHDSPTVFREAGGMLRLLSARVAWKRRDLRRAAQRCDAAITAADDPDFGTPYALADARLFRALLLFETGDMEASAAQLAAAATDVVDASPRLRAQRDALADQLARCRNAK